MESSYPTSISLRGMGLGQDIYGAYDTNVTAWYQSLGIRTPKALWAWA